ncbi:MAG: hypothetical protein V3U71_05825 [Cocleimonas sp.]
MTRQFSYIIVLLSMLFSFNASACDDKSCEKAYLAQIEQYVANDIRRAEAFRIERRAHALNRERRDYAFYVHRHLIRIAKKFVEDPLKYKNLITLGSKDYLNVSS